jgi:hypothetical protein
MLRNRLVVVVSILFASGCADTGTTTVTTLTATDSARLAVEGVRSGTA